MFNSSLHVYEFVDFDFMPLLSWWQRHPSSTLRQCWEPRAKVPVFGAIPERSVVKKMPGWIVVVEKNSYVIFICVHVYIYIYIYIYTIIIHILGTCMHICLKLFWHTYDVGGINNLLGYTSKFNIVVFHPQDRGGTLCYFLTKSSNKRNS